MKNFERKVPNQFAFSSFKLKLLHPCMSIFHRFNAFKPQDDARSYCKEVKIVVFREMMLQRNGYVKKCLEKLSKS